LKGKGKEDTILRLLSLVMLILLFIAMLSPCLGNVQAGQEPQGTLRVSLPAGTIVGANPDPWLNEGWLLNITGASGTFTVRINNTAPEAVTSLYLVVALDDPAYNNLLNLTVDDTPMPKANFENGTPTPYFWTWPDDVYPTWFACARDIIPGHLLPWGYIDLTVSAEFSGGLPARMHFDAYGWIVCPGPITYSPNSDDSTVIFSPLEQCEVTFLTDPVCDQYYISFEGGTYYDGDVDIFDYGTSGLATAHCAEGWEFDHWEVTGNVEVSSTTENPTTVTISCGGTLKAVCISACKPTALFTATSHSPKVVFNASSSYDTDGYIVSYTWDFGDGNITTVIAPVVIHNYAADGTYNVTLTVIDNDGLTDSAKNNFTTNRLEGDVNGDGKVRVDDIYAIALAFGLESGDPGYDLNLDINGDGKIRVDDILLAATNFGEG